MHSRFNQVLKSSLQKPALGFIVCYSIFVSVLTIEANIETKNPFLPHNYGKKAEVKTPPPRTAANGPLGRELELRGMIKMGGKYRFSIFNKKES